MEHRGSKLINVYISLRTDTPEVMAVIMLLTLVNAKMEIHHSLFYINAGSRR